MNRQEKNVSGGLPYLDFLRFLAISMVILIHVVSGVADTIPERMTETQLTVYRIIKELCTPGVPLFLMISGALFLAPEKEIPLSLLFRRYLRRILLALALFGTFYAFLELSVTEQSLRPLLLLEAFGRMLAGDSWAHMWYLYVLIGLYLFLPLLKIFTAHADAKTCRYMLLILFTANSLLPFLKQSFGLSLGIEFPTAGIYLYYFLCGHYLHSRKLPEKKGCRAEILTLFLCTAVLLINGIFGFGLSMQYDSPFIVFASMAIFTLAGFKKPSWRFCVLLREHIFAVYLVHTFFLNIAYKFFDLTPLIGGGYLLLPVFWAGCFALSLLFAWTLRKIPPLRKYVL